MIERERIEMLCSCFNQFVCKANELLSTLNFQGTVNAIQTALESSRQGEEHACSLTVVDQAVAVFQITW